MKQQIRFQLERKTKRTYRFQEVGSDFVGVLYVQQHAFPVGADPDSVIVTIETPDK